MNMWDYIEDAVEKKIFTIQDETAVPRAELGKYPFTSVINGERIPYYADIDTLEALLDSEMKTYVCALRALAWQNTEESYELLKRELENKDAWKRRAAQENIRYHGMYGTIELPVKKKRIPMILENETKCEYRPEDQMLIVEITLQTVEKFLQLKKATGMDAYGNHRESDYSELTYDQAIYDIVFLTVKTIFDADNPNIKSIVLNGKVNTSEGSTMTVAQQKAERLNGKINITEESTGKANSPYILSVKSSKVNFTSQQSENPDSKEWFERSKGRAGATFAKVIPIVPIAKIDGSDAEQ